MTIEIKRKECQICSGDGYSSDGLDYCYICDGYGYYYIPSIDTNLFGKVKT